MVRTTASTRRGNHIVVGDRPGFVHFVAEPLQVMVGGKQRVATPGHLLMQLVVQPALQAGMFLPASQVGQLARIIPVVV